MPVSKENKRLLIFAAIAFALWFGGRYLYFLPRFASGTAAPEVSGVLPDGTPFRLSEMKDRYVLLHFWGSWCGPCRAENRELVELYKRYAGPGFAIVSIGIEQDTARWQRAISSDGLNWPHQLVETSPSLRFFNTPIANAFGVKKLPATFLLRPGLEVQATNPSLQELEAILGPGSR
jgi:thiol-disulfide isomerase/thioredoxin